MPSRTRPPESASSDASSLAKITGLRCGTIKIPVARLIVEVTPARYESQISGSGIGASSLPGIFPDGS